MMTPYMSLRGSFIVVDEVLIVVDVASRVVFDEGGRAELKCCL